MFNPNPLYYSDAYKVGHKKMLAPGTVRLGGTEIPRSLKYGPKGATHISNFGKQIVWRFIHDAFEENFFLKRDGTNRNSALQFVKDMSLMLGADYDGKHFEELWDLGYLPIEVKSLPEHAEVLPNVPTSFFINTVDNFAWLTLYLETICSSLAWKPMLAATIAKQYRKNTKEWVMKTDPDRAFLIDYMCHDFSSRGLNPHDMISVGLGHATSFRGSDTLLTIPAARYYYGEPDDESIINSVNASEHSVSTTKIFTVGEQQMIADWLQEFPTGILSIVSDTFDLWKLITEYLPANKEAIMARDGKLVIRPDSGDPVDIICGVGTKFQDISEYFPEGEVLPKYFEDYLIEEVADETPHGEHGVTEYEQTYIIRGKLYKAKIHNISWNRYDKQYYFIDMYENSKITIEELEWKPSDKGVIELLWDIFGGTVNEQGYKLLDPHIGAIYGDSITLERQVEIYKRLEAKGFAATNIVLGVGSFTYAYNTRDSIGLAYKGAWFEVNDEDGISTGYPIYKDPITDDGTKKSLKGFQFVYKDEQGEYRVESDVTEEKYNSDDNELKTIYMNGEFFNQVTFKEIREKMFI